MEKFIEIITMPGVSQLFAGAIGGLLTLLLAPAIKWSYEKKRLKRGERIKLIEDVRSEILKCSSTAGGEFVFLIEHFVAMMAFIKIRKYLSDFDMKLVMYNDDRTYGMILEMLEKLEKKWDIE